MDARALHSEVQQLRQKVADLEKTQKRIEEYAEGLFNADDITIANRLVHHLGHGIVDGYEFDPDDNQVVPRVGIAVTQGELDALLALSAEKYSSILILTRYDGVVECGKAGLKKGDHDAKTTTHFYC